MDSKRLSRVLSAYLDGALRERDRRRVRRFLRKDRAAADLFAALKATRDALRELPTAPAPSHVVDQAVSKLRTLPSPSDTVMAAGEFLEQLLNEPQLVLEAYLDDELTGEQRRHVEEQLLVREEHRAYLTETQRLRLTSESLPKRSAPNRLVETALERIERRDWVEPVDPAAANDPSSRPGACSDWELAGRRDASKGATSRRGRPIWRSAGLLAASIALVFAAVELLPRDQAPEAQRQLALAPAEDQPIEEGMQKTLEVSEKVRAERDEAAPLLKAAPVAAPAEPAVGRRQVASSASPGKDAAAPPLLPLAPLAELRPGDVVAFHDRELRLVCVDVEAMYDRLRVVLIDHEVGMVEVDATRSSKEDRAAETEGMYVIEVSTSGGQLADILTDLYRGEQHRPLVAKVDLDAPSPTTIAGIARLKGGAAKTQAAAGPSAPSADKRSSSGTGLAFKVRSRPKEAAANRAAEPFRGEAASTEGSSRETAKKPSAGRIGSLRLAPEEAERASRENARRPVRVYFVLQEKPQ